MKSRNERTNKACNFFADTLNVDYISELSEKEVKELDKEYQDDVHLFPELKKFGY